MPESHLIARQPICNAALKVIGFELLYRMNHDNNNAIIGDGDSATIDVLLAAYNDLSITDVIGENVAFVNFTSNLIVNKLPPLPPKQLVIELLENQDINADLIKSLKQLRRKGYRIALDDFCLNKETLSLIECADIIKLDVLDQAPSTWKDYIPKLTERGITMLAEKVETYEVYEECKALGFTLFQGYFFAKPKILSGKKLSRNEISVINLMDKLNSEQVDYDEVISIISADVSLSYNLLRTLNSGMYTLAKKVESVRQAAIMLGINHLRNWINLLALGSLENKPAILLETSIIRAKMCELIGEKIKSDYPSETFFAVGLFSVLDAFFDTPLKQLIGKLSLSTSMQKALLEHEGILGKTLDIVIHYQEGKIDNNNVLFMKQHNLCYDALMQTYIDSLAWSKEAQKN